MPIYVEATSGEGIEIEDGTYEVECVGVEEAVMEKSQYDPNVYRFRLAIIEEGNDDPLILDPICSRKLSPMSKLWGWMAAFGQNPEAGKRFDIQACIGKHAMASIETDFNADGTKGFPKVKSLVGMPRGRQRAPVAPQTTPGADPAFDAIPSASVKDEERYKQAVARSVEILNAMPIDSLPRVDALAFIQTRWPETRTDAGRCDPRKISQEHATAMLVYLEGLAYGAPAEQEEVPFEV